MKIRPKKNEKAITLIALVVTIVVLLILVGVSISMLGGENGIITQSQNAKLETRGAIVEEEKNLWKLNKENDKYTGDITAETLDKVLKRLVNNGYLTEDEKKQIEENGKVTIGSRTIIFKNTITSLSFEKEEINLLVLKETINMPISNNVIDNIELSWKSSDTNIIEVDSNGKITAKSKGNCKIKCSLKEEPEINAEYSVNVIDGSEISADISAWNILQTEPSIRFNEIPSDMKLQVWIQRGTSGTEVDYTYLNNNPDYIIDTNNSTIKTINCNGTADIFYRLVDGENFTSDTYHFFSKDITCFTKDTIVSTTEGDKKIQEVKVNDMVYVMENGNNLGVEKVVRTFKNEVDYNICKIYTENDYIECTTGHEIYCKNKGWTKAILLEVGDILITQNNEEMPIVKIQNEKEDRKVTVYNLEVKNAHNYFVGKSKLLVHNAVAEPTCLYEYSGADPVTFWRRKSYKLKIKMFINVTLFLL